MPPEGRRYNDLKKLRDMKIPLFPSITVCCPLAIVASPNIIRPSFSCTAAMPSGAIAIELYTRRYSQRRFESLSSAPKRASTPTVPSLVRFKFGTGSCSSHYHLIHGGMARTQIDYVLMTKSHSLHSLFTDSKVVPYELHYCERRLLSTQLPSNLIL